MPVSNDGIRVRRRVSRSPTFGRSAIQSESERERENQPVCSKSLYHRSEATNSCETEKRKLRWIPQDSSDTNRQASFAAETVASRQRINQVGKGNISKTIHGSGQKLSYRAV